MHSDFFRNVLDASRDVCVVVDRKRNVVFANRAARSWSIEIFGGEICQGDPALQFTTEQTRATAEPAIARAFQGKSAGVEIELDPERTFELTFSPIEPEGERAAYVSVTARDISERRRAERGLRDSGYALQALIDTMPVAVVLMDPDSTIRAFNDFAGQYTRLTYGGRLEVGKPLTKWMSPQIRAAFGRMLSETLEGRTSGFDREHVDENGVKRWFHAETAPVTDETGENTGVCLLVTDVTERSVAQRELAESEESFRLLYEQAPLAYQSLDADACYLDVNQAWEELTGYARDEALGTWFGNIIVPEEREVFRERFPEFKKRGGRDILVRLQRKDGRRITVSFDGKIARDRKGNFVRTHCIMHDVTERLKLESEREELIERLQAALAEVKSLSGLLPICSSCKKIRDDEGYWASVETFIADHSQARFTHSICPNCARELYAGLQEHSHDDDE